MAIKKAFIIAGLGYGDEGKGLTTDYLCLQQPNAIVIRYNGGHQAGHTVVTSDGLQHVFSSFGSGTLRQVPSYLSKYCVFSPAYFLEEYRRLPIKPHLFLDKMCPVTTHYDVLYNRAIEKQRGVFKYGSCGVGFGATVDRHTVPYLKLYLHELFQPSELKKKLRRIRLFYKEKIKNETDFNFDQFEHDAEDLKFKEYIEQISQLISSKIIEIVTEKDIFCNQIWNTYIFEGAQGILLDKQFGNKPYVTKSHTTSKNAIEILKRHFANKTIDKEIYYVTRAYLTRHGEGPFEQFKSILELKNNADETNTYNPYQGNFKTSYLDIDLLNYSLDCDLKFTTGIKKHLIVTCMDQLTTNGIYVVQNGELTLVPHEQLSLFLNCEFETCSYSFSNCSEDLINSTTRKW